MHNLPFKMKKTFTIVQILQKKQLFLHLFYLTNDRTVLGIFHISDNPPSFLRMLKPTLLGGLMVHAIIKLQGEEGRVVSVSAKRLL